MSIFKDMKKIIKHIAIYLVLINFLTSAVGLSINLHHCGHSGKTFVSFLIADNDKCDCHEEPCTVDLTVLENTCENCNTEHKNDNCCSNKIEHKSLEFDTIATFVKFNPQLKVEIDHRKLNLDDVLSYNKLKLFENTPNLTDSPPVRKIITFIYYITAASNDDADSPLLS